MSNIIKSPSRAGSIIVPSTWAQQFNLVPNGHAELGTNYGWSQAVYDKVNTFEGSASFQRSGLGVTLTSDILIPVDYNRHYLVSYWAASTTHVVGAHAYFGLAPYDVDGLAIAPDNVMWYPNTLTTLAADLHPGDTTITLTSAVGWQSVNPNTYQRMIIIWDYVDSKGNLWAPQTYSRHNLRNTWASGGITGNVITLVTPWVGYGRVIPAGTPVSNGNSGGTFMYCCAANVDVPATWTQYQGIVAATYATAGNAPSNQWWPGIAQVKMLLLLNRDVSGNVTNFTNVVLQPADLPPGAAPTAGSNTIITGPSRSNFQ